MASPGSGAEAAGVSPHAGQQGRSTAPTLSGLSALTQAGQARLLWAKGGLVNRAVRRETSHPSLGWASLAIRAVLSHMGLCTELK